MELKEIREREEAAEEGYEVMGIHEGDEDVALSYEMLGI